MFHYFLLAGLCVAAHFEFDMFDWDDNVMFLDVRNRIWFKDAEGENAPETPRFKEWTLLELSSKQYAEIRSDKTLQSRELAWDGDWEKSFEEFGDGPDDFLLPHNGRLFNSVMKGIGRGRFGPAFPRLKASLVQGRPFAIITARGHNEVIFKTMLKSLSAMVLTVEERQIMLANLRRNQSVLGGKLVVAPSDNDLLDEYFERVRAFNVNSPEFKNRHFGGRREKTEVAKQKAMDLFVHSRLEEISEAIKENPSLDVSFSMSDDDKTTLESLVVTARELSERYPAVTFKVYDTSDGKSCQRIFKVSKDGTMAKYLTQF